MSIVSALLPKKDKKFREISEAKISGTTNSSKRLACKRHDKLSVLSTNILSENISSNLKDLLRLWAW